MTAAYVIMALCVLLGVPFTLWWWKEADKWADAEHKRFKDKPREDVDAVVVKWDQAETNAKTHAPGNAPSPQGGAKPRTGA